MGAQHQYLTVAGQIRRRLDDIESVALRVEHVWREMHPHGSDWYVDAVALNLHGFYAGVEQMLELIADAVDQTKPAGPDWNRALLLQMAAEVPGVRPPVLSPELRDRLDRFRGFRHVVRNVYTFNLDPAQVEQLVQLLPRTVPLVRTELTAFADVLVEVASE